MKLLLWPILLYWHHPSNSNTSPQCHTVTSGWTGLNWVRWRLDSPFQHELLARKGKRGRGRTCWPNPTQETVVGRRTGTMMTRGKASWVIGNFDFLCIILYRIIHVKEIQHIMKGPVNFLKKENNSLNLFSSQIHTCFVRKKKSMQFPTRPRTDTPPIRQP